MVFSYFYTQRRKFIAKELSKKIMYSALLAKVIGSILFCYFYQTIYKGGDTLHYHNDASLMAENIFIEPVETFKELFWDETSKKYTGNYQISGKYSFMGTPFDLAKNMVRITTFFELLSFSNFYGTAILISFFAFTGLWKIYELICSYFKDYKKNLSLILFVPTILFWTGGILKDSLVFGSICWAVFSLFTLLNKKESLVWSISAALASMFVLISLKPYVLLVLISTLTVGIFANFFIQLKNRLTSLLLLPIFLFGIAFFLTIIMSLLKGQLGVYGEYESLLELGSVVKSGFDQTVGVNAVKLGNFDTSNLIGSFSIIGSVLFRPFIWESWNVISLFASIENFVLLALTMVALLSVLFQFRLLNVLIKSPFLIFCISFSLVFSIGLGLSISNFGALMRFKSAFLIFYVIPLIVLFEEARSGAWKVKTIKKDKY